MALGSTQPLKEISRAFPGGKCGRCVRLTTVPLSCAVIMKSGNLNFLEPSGSFQACNGTDLPLFFHYRFKNDNKFSKISTEGFLADSYLFVTL